MPFVNLKIAGPVGAKKEAVVSAVTAAVQQCLGKPVRYIMAGVEEQQELWFAGKKMDKGAFVAVSCYGDAGGAAYSRLTGEICKILEQELGIAGGSVYVAYYPLENWGFAGSNF